jgi:uncharacterized membrane protein YdfJ with MMPL/SSD domain
MTEKMAPQELLVQIRSFISITKAHVGSSNEIDLTGLDGKVQELCEAVLDMPKPEADSYQQALSELVIELDELKAKMISAQEEVRDKLNALNMRHKAAKAYKTGEATKPTKKNE